MGIHTYISANHSSIEFLQQALNDVAEQDYLKVASPAFQSSIGAHIRHIIEHYLCFFSQLPENQTINYDLRERDIQIETNIKYAQACLAQISEKLMSFSCDDQRELYVSDNHCDYLIRSSLSRELMFLIGHSEHHSAMIAAMLRIYGYAVDNQFGVANATLTHEALIAKQELSA